MTATSASLARRAHPRAQYRPFTLTLDLTAPRMVVSLRRPPPGGPVAHGRQGRAQRLAALEGRRAQGALPAVLEMLHRRGFSLPRLEERGRGRLRLDEALGARIVLLLWAMAPVQKPSRWALLRAGIAAMVDEEVLYWYAKAAGERAGARGQNALRALRLLLAGE
jgi:hypothetical protein